MCFPAWPKGWDASFRLLARGGFSVAGAIEMGRPGFVEIESHLGEPCRVRNPWSGKCAVLRGTELILESDEEVVEFATEEGTLYLLVPAESGVPDRTYVSSQPRAQPSLVFV